MPTDQMVRNDQERVHPYWIFNLINWPMLFRVSRLLEKPHLSLPSLSSLSLILISNIFGRKACLIQSSFWVFTIHSNNVNIYTRCELFRLVYLSGRERIIWGNLRAHELKEEGNKRFQAKDYVGALEQYDNALKLTPKTHPDRAVFHSNRAACLMQMKPIDYETVITECTMALQVQPQYVRALVRRARAFEAIGKYEMAMQDVQALLGADPNHRDALEITRRLRTALGPRPEAQQDLQSRPSPAALGASAVRGAPIAGLGPSLPARPVPKKAAASAVGSNISPNNKLDKPQQFILTENGP
ncbi:hypothetical protein F0562_014414 [Nyssa sinensis]|uniref:Uncharacterized protein n=1 Tax=Nyssa sinensis TaxID=561372 RepID=A0A5J4ZR23_9ASTE|nr:hypothetical protein F0562_014414 [Nyssa sinensis]